MWAPDHRARLDDRADPLLPGRAADARAERPSPRAPPGSWPDRRRRPGPRRRSRRRGQAPGLAAAADAVGRHAAHPPPLRPLPATPAGPGRAHPDGRTGRRPPAARRRSPATALTKRFPGGVLGPRPARPRRPVRVGLRAARPERCGQDDHAPPPRRAGPADRRLGHGGRDRARGARAQRADRVPRPGPALLRLGDRPRARGPRRPARRDDRRRRSTGGSARSSSGSGWPTRPTAGSAPTRAGCASDSGSPRPSSPDRRCSSSTSR